MIGRDTFSALAPMLGPYQKNWLCHPLPLFMAVSMITNTWYVTLELLLHAAFVADEIWGDMLTPARTYPTDHRWLTYDSQIDDSQICQT